MGMFIPEHFPQTDKYLDRILGTALAAPKVFLGAMLWEGFSLVATMDNLQPTSPGYYFLTGLGDFLGILTACLILMHVQCLTGNEYMKELHDSLVLATVSGLFAGTLWQFSVNLGVQDSFTFTETFFLVGTLGFATVFLLLYIIRITNDSLPTEYRLRIDPSHEKVHHDFQLAFVLGVADAFFVTTDGVDFADDWLASFAIYPDTDSLTAVMLAGSSATVGFLVAQCVLIFFLDDTWVDKFHVKLVRSIMSQTRLESMDDFDRDDWSPANNNFVSSRKGSSSDSTLSLEGILSQSTGNLEGRGEGEQTPLLTTTHTTGKEDRKPRSGSEASSNGLFF